VLCSDNELEDRITQGAETDLDREVREQKSKEWKNKYYQDKFVEFFVDRENRVVRSLACAV